MTLRTRKRPYWSCRRCGYRNLRAHVKCRGRVLNDNESGYVDCAGRRPKKPVRAHARTLRDDGYAVYVLAARDIHGVTDESCCVCGKPRSQERRHDRDHDHITGKPRGLACPGNRGCNVLMLPWISAPVAQAIWSAKERAGEPDAGRWLLIKRYLKRVEAYYSERLD